MTNHRDSARKWIKTFAGKIISDRGGYVYSIADSRIRTAKPYKAELLQLYRTQFPSLGIFISKKVGNLKN